MIGTSFCLAFFPLASFALMSSEPPQHVVIAGAGIIGTCTAYYLAKEHGIRSTVVDPVGLAPAASGKAGGFLAEDWNSGSPTDALTRRSFALHQQLADDLGASTIDYRRLTCSAVSVTPVDRRRPTGKKLQGVEWVQEAAAGVRLLGDESTIAQVHPKKLCHRLWEETTDMVDSRLVTGKVSGALHDASGRLTGAKIENGSVIEGDALLFACGPWTANFMKGIKYHSAVVPTNGVLTQCVFFSGCGDPEVYVRPDSTAYCTGFPEAPRVVKEQPGKEDVLPEKIKTILSSVREASGSTDAVGPLSRAPVLEQACYLPTTDDGLPVMGLLPKEATGGDGCYIATGHTCWGILLGPASGEAMASVIATGQSSLDLRRFDPARFRNINVVTNV